MNRTDNHSEGSYQCFDSFWNNSSVFASGETVHKAYIKHKNTDCREEITCKDRTGRDREDQHEYEGYGVKKKNNPSDSSVTVD